MNNMPKKQIGLHRIDDESLRNLESVFIPEEEIALTVEGPPLFQTCKIIGRKMDLQFKLPATAQQDIENICEASSIRYRKVSLNKYWWKESQGHLLGFLKETHHPVALINYETHYEIIDPISHQKIKVDERTAESLSLVGYAFYRSLPDESLNLSKIFKLCLSGITHDYFILIFIGLIATALGFFFPLANKVLFDYVIPDYNISLYVQVMVGLVLATFSAGFFIFMRSLLVLHLDGIIQNRLQMALWDRLLKLPIWFFHKFATGDLIQRTFVIENLRRIFTDNTIRILLNSFFGLTYLVVMFVYSWQLSLLGILIALMGSLFSGIVFLIKLYYQRKLLASNAIINSFLIQVINAISKVRLAVAENQVFAHWAREFALNQRLKLKTLALQVNVITFNTVLGILSYVLLFAFVIWLNQPSESEEINSKLKLGEHAITVGTFLAFNAAFFPFTQSIFDLANTLLSVIELIPFWERARPIFTTPLERTKDKVDPGELQGEMYIENVYFRYDKNSAFILSNFSINANPGDFIGIVGPSGSGKSTLCRILIGFEMPEKGVVLYDNKDLSSLDSSKVREQIGVILQGNSIFTGTIKDNICCGMHFSKEEISKAIELATFDRDLVNLPMGLETILPSGGGVLSGGQRQRLLLARAVIKQPKILILDEATSALDNQTQDEVQKNLESLKTTRIVVAHRLSTVQNADRIYVMENGRNVETGKYDELTQKKGLFARLVEKQKG